MMTPPPEFLQAAIHHISGFHYGRGTGPVETDCCRYVEAVVRMWKQHELVDYPESKADLNVWSAAKPWSPVAAAEKLGIALETGHYMPGNSGMSVNPGVFLCQGWRQLTPLGGGHTFLIWMPAAGTESMWCYEATNRVGRSARPWGLAEKLDGFTCGVRWARLSDG